MSFETLCAYGHHYIIFNVWEISTDIATNTSKVGWSIQMRANAGWGFSTIGSTIVASIDGQQVYNQYAQRSCSAGTTTTWASGEATISHNSDGTKTAYCECAYTQSSTTSWTPGNGTASGNITLSTIPRYANITELYTSNVTGYHGVHALNVHWNADAVCDALQYSLNGGAWVDSAYSPFTIWNLAPNTQYNVRIRLRRQDSQLWTESGYVYGTTKQINYITSGIPNITNGQSLRVTATNPSGANCQIILEVPAGTRRIIKSGTDVTFTEDEVNSMMQYITGPTSTTRVTADTLDDSGNIGYSAWNDGTYTLVDSNPTFNTFEFEDINEKTIALTGNNQDCIIGYSDIQVKVSVANKAVAKNYATMSKYRFVCGGNNKEATYSDSEDVTMLLESVKSGTYTVHAIDSRGLSTSVERVANTVIDYQNLTKGTTITASRVDDDGNTTGVDEKVRVKFNGTIWKGNFGTKDNSILSVKYRYKISGTEDWSEYKDTILPTIAEDGTFTFDSLILGDTDEGFDISNGYNLEFVVLDELSSVTYTANIGSGTPHVAYHKNGVSIMGKYDTNEGGLFQIRGKKAEPGMQKIIGKFGWTKEDSAIIFGTFSNWAFTDINIFDDECLKIEYGEVKVAKSGWYEFNINTRFSDANGTNGSACIGVSINGELADDIGLTEWTPHITRAGISTTKIIWLEENDMFRPMGYADYANSNNELNCNGSFIVKRLY